MKKRFFIVALMGLFSAMQIQAQVQGDCCCNDCDCPQGAQGPQGLPGPAGFQGPLGLQGPVGGTGPQGPCCHQGGTFANIWSELDQFSIAPGASPLLEGVNIATLGIDVSMAGVTGEITVNIPGTYSVAWDAAGELTPPYPAPVPSISMALYLDGVLIPGSGSAAFLSSPNDVVENLGEKIQIAIAAGQVLKIVNTTILPLDLKANPLGTTDPVASASLRIRRIAP